LPLTVRSTRPVGCYTRGMSAISPTPTRRATPAGKPAG
jgi:hypothetical protein